MIPLPATIVGTGRVTTAPDGAMFSWPEPLVPQPQTEPSVPRTVANWPPTEMPAMDTWEPGRFSSERLVCPEAKARERGGSTVKLRYFR